MVRLKHQPVNRVVKIDRNRSDLFGEENVVEPRVLHNRPGRFIVGGPFEEEDQPWKTTQNRAADFLNLLFHLVTRRLVGGSGRVLCPGSTAPPPGHRSRLEGELKQEQLEIRQIEQHKRILHSFIL